MWILPQILWIFLEMESGINDKETAGNFILISLAEGFCLSAAAVSWICKINDLHQQALLYTDIDDMGLKPSDILQRSIW